MRVLARVLRWFFALVFVGGGISHVHLGRSNPAGYEPFGDTAVLPPLARLWEAFVMPNIGWLTLLLAAFEIAVGIGLALGGSATRLAALAALGFLGFILVLGYGFTGLSGLERFVKNHLVTVVMMAMVIVVLTSSQASTART